MKKKVLPFLLLPLLAFAYPPDPGIVMVLETTALSSGETWENRVSVIGDDLLMEFAESGGRTGSMVYLAGSEELIMNDDEERTYMRVDRAFLENLAENMSAMMKQMEQAMAAMPEAQREMIMNAAGGRMGMGMMERPTIEVRETGQTDTMNGYRATRYDMYVNDMWTQEMWIADWDAVEGAAEVRGAFQGLASLWQGFLDAMGQAPFGGNSLKSVADFDRGVPVVTYDMDEDGNRSTETVLRSINEQDVNRAAFGPKDGYREQKVEMPRMPGL